MKVRANLVLHCDDVILPNHVEHVLEAPIHAIDVDPSPVCIWFQVVGKHGAKQRLDVVTLETREHLSKVCVN